MLKLAVRVDISRDIAVTPEGVWRCDLERLKIDANTWDCKLDGSYTRYITEQDKTVRPYQPSYTIALGYKLRKIVTPFNDEAFMRCDVAI